MERGDRDLYRLLQSHLPSGESLGKQERQGRDREMLVMTHRKETQISIQSPSMREFGMN